LRCAKILNILLLKCNFGLTGSFHGKKVSFPRF